MKIQEELFKLQDISYKEFHSKLIPTVDKNTIIGIRIPLLRSYAMKIKYTKEADKFLIYRIDKMDEVRKDEEIVRKKNFDLDSFLQSSFHMFKGDPQTITCRFSSDMSNAVMDQFGTNYILKEAGEDYFTISIRTAITPTLISWIMQYGDKVKVLGPNELIDKLVSTAKGVIKQYE